jgi:hypothetical protein
VTRSPPSQPPSVPKTYPLLPIQNPPASPVTQPLPSISSNSGVPQGQDSSTAIGKELLESLVYPEGEIPVSAWRVDNTRFTNGCPVLPGLRRR